MHYENGIMQCLPTQYRGICENSILYNNILWSLIVKLSSPDFYIVMCVDDDVFYF